LFSQYRPVFDKQMQCGLQDRFNNDHGFFALIAVARIARRLARRFRPLTTDSNAAGLKRGADQRGASTSRRAACTTALIIFPAVGWTSDSAVHRIPRGRW